MAERRPPIGNERGLTALLATLLAAGVSIVGLVIDAATGKALGTIFDICFVLGCAAALCVVRRQHLRMAITLPPLLYCLLALVGGAFGSSQNALSLRSQALAVLSALVVGAPVLFLATGLTIVIGVARALAGRRRPARPAGRADRVAS